MVGEEGEVKIITKENPRIIIKPNYYPWENLGVVTALCDEIKRDVQRHVDGVSQVSVEWDSKTICSDCGLEWEEDESGIPVCCKKAIQEWKDGEQQ